MLFAHHEKLRKEHAEGVAKTSGNSKKSLNQKLKLVFSSKAFEGCEEKNFLVFF